MTLGCTCHSVRDRLVRVTWVLLLRSAEKNIRQEKNGDESHTVHKHGLLVIQFLVNNPLQRIFYLNISTYAFQQRCKVVTIHFAQRGVKLFVVVF